MPSAQTTSAQPCRRPRGATLAAASIAAATLLAASAASAHPFSLYGFGSRSTAMGGAGTATATGASAVHYNPARLTTGPSSAFIGGYATFNDLEINLANRPAGYDILGSPGRPSAWPVIPTEYRLNERKDPEQPGTGFNFALGAVSDLGFDRFRVGFIAAIPVISTVDSKTTFADEREQYFSNSLQFDLMGARTEQATLEFATAYQLLQGLSIGLGASYMPATTLTNDGYLNAVTEPGNLDLNVGMSIPARIRPNFGLSWDEGPISAGLAYRSEQYMELAGDTLVQPRGTDPDAGGFPAKQKLNIIMNYQAAEVAAGLTGRFGETSVSLDATLERWSDYRDNHNNEARVSQNLEDFDTARTIDHGFSDTVNLRLGVEHALGNERFVRLGAGFLPTPVPDQTGRSNFVDNDKVVLSAGVGGLLKYGTNDITINVHTQLLNLLPRETVKKQLDVYPSCTSAVTDTICDEVSEADVLRVNEPLAFAEGLQTGNPGFPGWSSGGWALSAGLDATWNF